MRGLVAFAAGLALLLGGCGPAPEATEAGLAPDFELTDLAGNRVRLADFRGRPVVIDFWATWCPPCEFQVPELNALLESHRDSGDVVVLGVAVDVEGSEVVAPWVDEKGVEYTILLGDEALAREFGVVGFPTLVLIDPEGRIESLHVGLIEHADLETLVEPFSG